MDHFLFAATLAYGTTVDDELTIDTPEGGILKGHDEDSTTEEFCGIYQSLVILK